MNVGGEQAAHALRILAGLIRIGQPVRVALMEWHEHLSGRLAARVRKVGRRLELGAPVNRALRVLPFDPYARGALDTALGVHDRVGGDLAAMLDGVARVVKERHAAAEAAGAASAGVVLSARVVAGLPLVMLVALPYARAGLFDRVGLVTAVCGCLLTLGGMAWMNRLVPRVDAWDTGPAAVAELASAVLHGGVPLRDVLQAIAAHPPPGVEGELRRAARLTRLGLTWAEALRRSSRPALRSLGALLAAAEHSGLPLADSLLRWSVEARAQSEREFERAVRRAPVLMVIPLVTCVLPAFALIVLTPLLRSLGST